MPQIKDSFELKSNRPNFSRDQYATLESMSNVNPMHLDIGHISYCLENDTHYIFSGTNENGTARWNVLIPERLGDMVYAETPNDLLEYEPESVDFPAGKLAYCIDNIYFWAYDKQRQDQGLEQKFASSDTTGWFLPLNRLSESTYLSIEDAEETYLTIGDAEDTYLTIENAEDAYVTKTSYDAFKQDVEETYTKQTTLEATLDSYLSKNTAEETYLTIEDAENNYSTTSYVDESISDERSRIEGYLQANYLSKTSAEDTYLSKNSAEDTYLTIEDASKQYVGNSWANNIASSVSTLSSNVNTLSSNVNTLSGDISTLQGDVSALQGDVEELTKADQEIEGEIQGLQNTINDELKPGIVEVNEKIDGVKIEVNDPGDIEGSYIDISTTIEVDKETGRKITFSQELDESKLASQFQTIEASIQEVSDEIDNKFRVITKSEWDNLPDSEKSEDVFYFVY